MGASFPKVEQLPQTMKAIQDGDVSLLQALSRSTNLTGYLKLNHSQTTALHLAAVHGQPECIQFLLELGANIHDLDSSRESVLHSAVVSKSQGWSNCLSLILKAKADINALNVWRRTPLMKAIVNFKIAAANYLIQEGADVSISDENGTTPLHVAASYGNIGLVKTLLDNRANNNAQDQRGRTPVYFAILGGHEEVTEHLIQHGCEVNLYDLGWGSPLQLSVTKCNIRILSLLLKSGACFNVQPKNMAAAPGIIDIALKIALKRVNIYRNEVTKQDNDVSCVSKKRACDSLECLQLLIVASGLPVYEKMMKSIHQLVTQSFHKDLQKPFMDLHRSATKAHKSLKKSPPSLQYLARKRCRKLLMTSNRNLIWACERLDVPHVIIDLLTLQS
ncbi:serine/threonine-protein phosphatase 6 regulatory ankyrin repeat subunit C-like [Pecten maximus]|uniref:serine/threonine-protein phosphatase 6 regulatory ankyrin repeat subunit C-like n=1 Tax=Pecten maximus TaxID=6579 RepID=UPI001457F8F2|nr:serine/threonine-protein phosphatase 6 regulatory ankyrin repeat subunit C-like [Pecten maximus]